MSEKEFVYDLSDKIRISNKGDFGESAQIVLGSPNYFSFREASRFSSFIMRAIASNQKNVVISQEEIESAKENKESDDGIKPNELKMILFSSDQDIPTIMDCFIELACKVGKVDEEVKLKKAHFSRICYEDSIGLMVGYACFFVLPSILSEEEEKNQEKEG